jgi:SAM-dependent methyltransferase
MTSDVPSREDRWDSRDPWDAWYRAERPPWETQRPQPAVARLADSGAFVGDVLDCGCGTGENALLLASRGLRVLGIDWAASAVERARGKAGERSLDAEFVVADALALGELGRSFDTVLDSALFHTFGDEARERYVPSLASAMRPGSTLFLLCFSDLEPWGGGPRRVSQAEIHNAFGDGWSVRSIEPERYEVLFEPGFAVAWLATIDRTQASPDRPVSVRSAS